MTWPSVSHHLYTVADRFRVPARVQPWVSSHSLAIVMYHGVVQDPLPVPDWCFIMEEQFANEMRYLSEHTYVLPLSLALEQLRSGALQSPAVAITFDDGFQSVHDIAFPILQQLSLPSTVFLVTRLIGTPWTLWFCGLIQSLSATRNHELTWRGVRYDLRGADARAVTSKKLQVILKEFHPVVLSEALGEIVSALGLDGRIVQEASPPFQILDQASITRMHDSGLVEFGAHTETHAILTRIERDLAVTEMQRSVERTAELTSEPCRLFAYPNGRRQDYDHSITEVLRRAGIRNAVTTVPGPNKRDTPALELRRYGVTPGAPIGRFQVDVHHLRTPFLRNR